MKQLVHNKKTGELSVAEVPPPAVKTGGVIVRNQYSVISLGTERASVDLGKLSMLGKARARPDDARRVLASVRQNGLRSTYQKVSGTLDRSYALGYSCAGVITAIGEDVVGLEKGDRVACAGAGYANHADVVQVPQNLVARIPNTVDTLDASFTTIGAVAMQGVRQADPRIGERVAVIGLGLVGQLTCQLLRSAGCQVTGIDIDAEKAEIARSLGLRHGLTEIDSPRHVIDQLTDGIGFDAVIITASTRSREPVNLAAELSRERGTVVIVGDVSMELQRKPFYEKELTLLLSKSYGPGRYDRKYEEEGQDYPIGYVRWTENRNMQSFLELLRDGAVNVSSLVTHRFPIEEALGAFDIQGNESGKPVVGVVLEYGDDPFVEPRVESLPQEHSSIRPGDTGVLGVGVIGVGSFARSTLLPLIGQQNNVRLVGVAAATGTSAADAARRFEADYCTTDYHQILDDEDISAVVVATRHDIHARIVMEAVQRGKAVFVEKPLALNTLELQELIAVVRASRGQVMVGFNRRYAPMVQRLHEHFGSTHGPMVMSFRVNAGALEEDHWSNDPAEGGGRVKGEVCHFVDLAAHIAGQRPTRVSASKIPSAHKVDENIVATIDFADGSSAGIFYTALGDVAYGKERFEVFCDGKVAVIDDFQQVELIGRGRSKRYKRGRHDKGHGDEMSHFFHVLQHGEDLAEEFWRSVESTQATLTLVDSLQQDTVLDVQDLRGA
jgi:predicted dehydrogenase